MTTKLIPSTKTYFGIKEPGDFCFDKWEADPNSSTGFSPTEIWFVHPRCNKGKCCVRITTGPASHPFWHWDGNQQSPTLSPSIGCDNAPRCGQHFNITNGEITP